MGRQRSGGWTLIELVVVLTVFGMLMAYGMPLMSTMLANGKVRTAAETLQGALATAQAEALRRSAPVELLLTTVDPTPANVAADAAENASNWLVRMPQDASRGLTEATFLRGSETAQDVAAKIENRSGATRMAFSASGRLLSQGTGGVMVRATANQVFRVTAAGADRPLCVYVSVSGGVKACDPQLAASDFRACLPRLSASECPSGVGS